MPIYAIGDVQGCYDELQNLLQTIAFDPAKDELWFAGDLVNRGPKSLEVLRFIKSLPKYKVVLGNHDIHLLAIANGHPFKQHTMHDVLMAEDCDELIDWLRNQPLLHYDPHTNFAMVHAGLLPQWHIEEAEDLAHEVEALLRGKNYPDLLSQLYGNKPTEWYPEMHGWERYRFIVNVFTRLRFCTATGKLDFTTKGDLSSQPKGHYPWFAVPERANRDTKILFGHWAALEGITHTPNVYALDTGCVWGAYLTAMRLEDGQRFSVRSQMKKSKMSGGGQRRF